MDKKIYGLITTIMMAGIFVGCGRPDLAAAVQSDIIFAEAAVTAAPQDKESQETDGCDGENQKKEIDGQAVEQYLQAGNYKYYVTAEHVRDGFYIYDEEKGDVIKYIQYNIFQLKADDDNEVPRQLRSTAGIVSNMRVESDYLYFDTLINGKKDSNWVSIDNPFINTSESPEHWQYDIYELFRGASHEIYDTHKEYSHAYPSAVGEGTFYFSTKVPQITGTDGYSKGFNQFFLDQLTEDKAYADRVFAEEETGGGIGLGMEGLSISHTVEHGYRWGKISTAIEAQYYSSGRNWCEPKAVNFYTETGKVLALEDIFKVGPEEYLPVLEKILLQCRSEFSEDYDPAVACVTSYAFHEALPVPEDNQFMLTPSGIAFIYYSGEIDSTVMGSRFLLVPYDAVEELLNPEYFDVT